MSPPDIEGGGQAGGRGVEQAQDHPGRLPSEIPYNYSLTVPANATIGDDVSEIRQFPYNGRISRIYIAGDPSVQSLVGVRIGMLNTGEMESFVPGDPVDKTQFLPVPRQAVQFTPNRRIERGDQLKVQFGSQAGKARYVKVLVFVERFRWGER